MKKKIFIALISTVASACSFEQVADSLFAAQEPLDIALTLSVKEIKTKKGDSTYISHKLYYRNASGSYDSLNADLKGRGNSRLQLCYFPPLWIKFDKKNIKGTVFEGNKKLKLVMPCNSQSNNLILKEYLCYKLYELVTPYAFKTRLVNIDLTEIKRKNKLVKHEVQKGLLIEDVDKTAKRFNAKPMDEAKVTSTALHDTTAMRFDLFQFMISNTDWSKGFQHNSKLIYQSPNIFPLPYDFDMSGLVDADYAVVSQINGEQLPIESVRDRYYRGHCQSKEITDFVRREFTSKEEKFLSAPNQLKGQLSDKEIENIINYLQEFFAILGNDKLFEKNILRNCRN